MDNLTLEEAGWHKKTLKKEIAVLIEKFEKLMEGKVYIKELFIARYESGALHVNATLQFN